MVYRSVTTWSCNSFPTRLRSNATLREDVGGQSHPTTSRAVKDPTEMPWAFGKFFWQLRAYPRTEPGGGWRSAVGRPQTSPTGGSPGSTPGTQSDEQCSRLGSRCLGWLRSRRSEPPESRAGGGLWLTTSHPFLCQRNSPDTAPGEHCHSGHIPAMIRDCAQVAASERITGRRADARSKRMAGPLQTRE